MVHLEQPQLGHGAGDMGARGEVWLPKPVHRLSTALVWVGS